MRPIKLKMQAFEPYVKSVELDFESGLNGEKFFLIHGATGAGKTSILDAICYALYNKSSGDERKIDNLRSELAADEIKTEVEFTFALGKKIYRVKRGLKKKTVKGEIKFDSTAELFIDDELKCAKVTEVNDFLKNCLGFNVEQFRQVVMLPQGKFKDFLKASSNEKMGILNLIFNSALYAKIEAELKAKFNEVEKLKENLNNQRENFLSNAQTIGKISAPIDEKILSDLIKNFGENFKKSAAERDDLKIQLDKANAEHSDGKILNADFSAFETAAKNFQVEKNFLIEVEKKFEVTKIEFERRKGEESQRNELELKVDSLKKIQESVKNFQVKIAELVEAETREKSAQEKISELEKLLKKAKIALEDRKSQREKFKGAEVKFNLAEQNLKKSQDKQKRLLEIERLKKELAKAQKNLATAEKNYNAAQKELNRLKLLQKMCTAALLAENLQDGEPCPVCGSTSHPKLAFTEEIIPTDEEIEKKEIFLEKKLLEKNSANRALDSINVKINFQAAEIEKLADVLKLDEAEKIFDAAKNDLAQFKDFEKRVSDGEKFISDKEAELKIAQENHSFASNNAATLRGTVKTLQSQIPAEYLEDPKKISADLKKNLQAKKILVEAWEKVDRDFRELDRKKSAQEGKFKSAEQLKSDAAKKIDGKVKPDISALEKIAQEKRNLYDAAVEEVTAMKKDLAQLNEISAKLSELAEKIQLAEKNFQLWGKLSDVANAKNPAKMTFQSYYLNAMFQNVIFEANERLEKMSDGRYKFIEGMKKHAQKSGLDLDIFDANTGKARPVETLSGGESFLAALSLALGLAAVVKNSAGGINLDTIFIDEGFGSLDSETLDFALNALADLQRDGGRLVGIISHVEELKQRIPARLEVIKTKLGSTAKFI